MASAGCGASRHVFERSVSILRKQRHCPQIPTCSFGCVVMPWYLLYINRRRYERQNCLWQHWRRARRSGRPEKWDRDTEGSRYSYPDISTQRRTTCKKAAPRKKPRIPCAGMLVRRLGRKATSPWYCVRRETPARWKVRSVEHHGGL